MDHPSDGDVPPTASTAVRSTVKCSSTSAPIAADSSQRWVEPSMSVNRNVTVASSMSHCVVTVGKSPRSVDVSGSVTPATPSKRSRAHPARGTPDRAPDRAPTILGMTEARPATVASPAGVAGGERRASRNRGLDGIRGVAAAMVVAHHLALCGGWMSDPFAEQPAISSGFERAMTYTPLHLLWAGGEAVFVFFVLSGYVLARTDVSTPRRTAGFVGKRFVRLYVPAVAAIALATVQFVLIRRRAGEEDGWLRWHGTALGWSDPLQLATLVTDTGQQVDSVLWSLRWEVLFSAVVPIALACLALAIGRRAPYVATALCACIALSIYQSTGVLFYLPMFLLGTLAALNEAAIGRRVDRLRRHVPDGALAAIALVLAALMLSVRWWANPVRLTDVHAVQQALAGLEQLVVVLGACVAVLAVVHVASARRFLEAGVLLRLGSRSFSLYLVHEPVDRLGRPALRPAAPPARLPRRVARGDRHRDRGLLPPGRAPVDRARPPRARPDRRRRIVRVGVTGDRRLSRVQATRTSGAATAAARSRWGRMAAVASASASASCGWVRVIP